MPPMEGVLAFDRPGSGPAARSCCPGSSPSAPSTTPAGWSSTPPTTTTARAVVIGGGLLGLEAARGLQSHGLEVDVVHSGRWLMNAQLGRDGGEVLRRSMAALGIGVVVEQPRHRGLGPGPGARASGCATTSEIECDLVVVAAGIRPNTDVAADQRVHGRARHRRGRPAAHRGRRRRLRGGGVRPAPRPGLRPGRPAVGAGRRARRRDHRRRPRRRLPRLADGHQAQGGRRRGRLDGAHRARAGDRRAHRLLRAGPGRLQVRRHPRRQGGRRHPAGRQPQGRLPAAGLRPRAAAAGGAGRADVRPRRARRGGRARPSWPTTPRSATATGSARRRSPTASPRAARRSPG